MSQICLKNTIWTLFSILECVAVLLGMRAQLKFKSYFSWWLFLFYWIHVILFLCLFICFVVLLCIVAEYCWGWFRAVLWHQDSKNAQSQRERTNLDCLVLHILVYQRSIKIKIVSYDEPSEENIKGALKQPIEWCCLLYIRLDSERMWIYFNKKIFIKPL